jgi:hypothetical protein
MCAISLLPPEIDIEPKPYRIQGTYLFSLLESSVGDASQKIARLLAQLIAGSTDSGSSIMLNVGLEGFNIGQFA